MIQLTRRVLICDETPSNIATLRESFDSAHAVHLPGFLSEDLLDEVQRAIRSAAFYDRSHGKNGDIGREECMTDNSALAMLVLLANDSRLLTLVRSITACAPIGCFDGRVYRMRDAAGHFDRWHSDTGVDRLIGMSVNLSETAYEGGRFELRSADSNHVLWQITNTGPGDAVMFRISDDLVHRVTAVQGDDPRTAFAGWFQSRPDFLSLLKSSTARRGPSGA
jgi:hypothetical protein